MTTKIVGIKVPRVDPLQAMITTTAVAKDLIAVLQFPPATAAVSTILRILQTLQSVQVNRVSCDRLAHRAAKILLDIYEQMRGRCDEAPEMLIRNLIKFESILVTIHEFMSKLTDLKWIDRFLHKSYIDDALAEYTRMLDEAAESFQRTSLIDIQLALTSLRGSLATAERGLEVPPPAVCQETLTELNSDIVEIRSPEVISGAPVTSGGEALSPPENRIIDHYLPQELSSLTLEDDHGFPRYHQSDVILRRRSQLKDGWWADMMEVQVQGKPALIKIYDEKECAHRDWLRDVKLLQNLYHRNLPQMIGFSDERTKNRFILLANVHRRTPRDVVREMLRSSSLGSCMETMFRFYRDLTDTVMHIQRQLNLDENTIQDFIEETSFGVDSLKNLVVGLPPPRNGVWRTAPSCGLSHILLDVCLRMLPNDGCVTHSHGKKDESVTEEMQKKINHLVTLARALLPGGKQSPVLPEKLEALIEEAESKPSSLTLRKIRELAWNADDGHNHTWHEKSVPPDRFVVGDIGYVPAGEDFDSFVLLGNVIKDGKVAFSMTQEWRGEQWCLGHLPACGTSLQASELSESIIVWPIVVPSDSRINVSVEHEANLPCIKDAWQYLLENGKDRAIVAGIRPEELILLTHVGTHQDFHVGDFRPKRLMPYAHGKNPDQVALATTTYLFTSLDPSHEPYWSSLGCLPKGTSESRQPLGKDFVTKIGWKTGYLRYVQLLAEDFDTT